MLYGISIGPAAFSAFMSKTFRPLDLSNNVIAHLDDVCTKQKRFEVLVNSHQILLKESMKVATDKSNVFLTFVKLFGHIIEGTEITSFKSRTDAILKLQ